MIARFRDRVTGRLYVGRVPQNTTSTRLPLNRIGAGPGPLILSFPLSGHQVAKTADIPQRTSRIVDEPTDRKPNSQPAWTNGRTGRCRDAEVPDPNL